MRILTVNVGSSSIRLDVFATAGGSWRRLASYHGAREDAEAAARVDELLARTPGDPVLAAVHRVVHGGERLVRPRVIDDSVEQEIRRLGTLAPLHNPAALAWVHACREVLGAGIPQVAVFDTAFFAYLPEVARTYALPAELCIRYGVRRYGFHGLAHRAMAQRAACLLPAGANSRVIALQLGAGCSAAAIHAGRPLDVSMGFSPLEGLMMATRSGDIDAGALTYLGRAEGWNPERLEEMLNHESGLLGVSGLSADMRTLIASTEPRARLAIDLYCYRARKYIGAYLATLGGADGIVFGGGVGENAPRVRGQILAGMAWAGIEIDAVANRAAAGREARISTERSQVGVWVIPVDEGQILAGEAAETLAAAEIAEQGDGYGRTG